MLKFFDCDVAAVSSTNWAVPTMPVELLPVMAHYGIEKALVYDRGAAEAGVFDDFSGVLRFCGDDARLIPTIPVAPPACGEGPSPDELVDIIGENRIGGVRVWPKMHNLDFRAKVFERLFERLEKRGIPVFYMSMAASDFPWEHKSDWDGISEVAKAFPKLPLIVVYSGMLEARRYIPVLEACPNVVIDLTMTAYQMIEFITENFGVGRLVMASHYPNMDPGLQTSWINHCGIDEEARRAIAFETLNNLVGGAR